MENLGSTFTKFGLYAAILIFLANIANLCINIAFNEDWSIFSVNTFNAIIEYVTLTITILMVAIPEGLPLTVAVALAYSVMRMKDQKILVRNLNSPEAIGGI